MRNKYLHHEALMFVTSDNPASWAEKWYQTRYNFWPAENGRVDSDFQLLQLLQNRLEFLLRPPLKGSHKQTRDLFPFRLSYQTGFTTKEGRDTLRRASPSPVAGAR